jgi:hypothetical protein
MKKSNFSLLLFVVLALVSLESCSVQKSVTAKSMDIYGSGVMHKPVIADLDVSSTKVKGTYDVVSGTLFEAAKNEAIAQLLKESNADVIVEPKYELVQTMGSSKITISGYPATYKNFRSIEKSDIELLNVGIVQKAKVDEPRTVKKKNRVWVVVGSVVTAILLGIIIATSGG